MQLRTKVIIRRIAIMTLLLPLAVGCSQTAKPVFAPVDPPLVWPTGPDPARIKYIGQLASTGDLHPRTTGWEKFRAALTGTKRNWHRLATPKDVAVHRNKIYVADMDLGAVIVFDITERKTSIIDGMIGPTHVAITETRLFVSDPRAHSVAVFDHTGRRLATWGKGKLHRPAGLCFAPTNRQLYVVDPGQHCVLIFNDTGEFVGKFGRRGSGPGEFNFPLAIRFDPQLGLLVTDAMNGRVQRFDLAGEYIAGFGQKGDAAGTFSLPKGLACDSDGHIYVVDGKFENVQIFDPAGRLLLSFGREGQSPGQFWLPQGIFIDQQDRIWVADTYNRRIQVFQYLKSKEDAQ